MLNPFIPATYAIRNTNKCFENGDIGRYLVIPGQIRNACYAASALNLPLISDNNLIAKEMTNLKSTSKFFKGLDNFIDFSAKNTNLLLSAAGLIRVMGAQDKKEAACKETCSLAFMFGAENIMKKIRKKIGLLNNIKYASLPKKLLLLGLDSILQIGTSIISYNYGAKMGLRLNKFIENNKLKNQQQPRQLYF